MKIFLIESKQELELAKGAELEMTKSNALYDFEGEGEERTTELQLPATAHNQRVLDFANSLHTIGAKMRQRYSAYLIEGISRYDGYLYILDYNYEDKSYNICFVFGDKPIWGDIKDLGNLQNFVFTDAYTVVTNEDIRYNGNSSVVWEKLAYRNSFTDVTDFCRCLPAINLEWLVTDVINPILEERLGVRVEWPTWALPYANSFIYLPNTINFFNKVGTLRFRRWIPPTPSAKDAYSYYELFDSYVTADSHTVHYMIQEYPVLSENIDDGELFYYDAREHMTHTNVATGTVTNFSQNVLIPMYDMELSFPSDFPDEVFLKKDDETLNETGVSAGDWDDYFIGGYGFRVEGGSVVTFGVPLRGRSVTIAKGTGFILCRSTEWLDITPPAGGRVYEWIDAYGATYYGEQGWALNPYRTQTYAIEVNIRIKADVTVKCLRTNFTYANKDVYPYGKSCIATLQANLPECDLFTLLKDFATMNGFLLYYEGATKTIKFDVGGFTDLSTYTDLSGRVIQRQTLERSFLDFARSNIVGFKDFTDGFSYVIDNYRLEASSELYELLAKRGTAWVNGSEAFYIKYVDDDYEEYGPVYCRWTRKPTYSATYLSYVTLTPNDEILTLCDKSTRVEVEVYMTLQQYERIRPFTIFFLDGHYWTWTGAEYSKPSAQLTLQMIR